MNIFWILVVAGTLGLFLLFVEPVLGFILLLFGLPAILILGIGKKAGGGIVKMSTTKKCTSCLSRIPLKATHCKYCGQKNDITPS